MPPDGRAAGGKRRRSREGCATIFTGQLFFGSSNIQLVCLIVNEGAELPMHIKIKNIYTRKKMQNCPLFIVEQQTRTNRVRRKSSPVNRLAATVHYSLYKASRLWSSFLHIYLPSMLSSSRPSHSCSLNWLPRISSVLKHEVAWSIIITYNGWKINNPGTRKLFSKKNSRQCRCLRMGGSRNVLVTEF